jgi:hypothetical protein
MRRLSFWCFLLMVMCSRTSAVAEDRQSFPLFPTYKSMLAELMRAYPRPSRIAAAGELWQGIHVATPTKESDSSKTLSIETDFWKLNVERARFSLMFSLLRPC